MKGRFFYLPHSLNRCIRHDGKNTVTGAHSCCEGSTSLGRSNKWKDNRPNQQNSRLNPHIPSNLVPSIPPHYLKVQKLSIKKKKTYVIIKHSNRRWGAGISHKVHCILPLVPVGLWSSNIKCI